MFFRRKRPVALTFEERLDRLRKAGLTVASLAGARARVSRDNCAADLREVDGACRLTGRAGMLLGGDIAALVDGGYQKFFRTADGRRQPATASQLQALHEFEEDIKEALGQDSYYNESLGTVSTYSQYDRVTDRDRGVPKRPWE
jgi:hypothetical protein